MDNKQKKVYASTQKYNNLQSVYWVDIGFAFDNKRLGDVRGIWDTGCTVTTISKSVAEKLALPVIGKVNCNTAGGLVECDRHMVDILLPNGVGIRNAIITSNQTLTVDCLVGTDVIAQGDFSVSNFNGKTIVSFRIPSQCDIDYVQWSKNLIPAQKDKKQDRNTLCACGSGKKYKNCCGKV